MTEPLWRRRVVERVVEAERQKLKRKRLRPPNGGWFDYMPAARVSPEFNKLMRAAAKARGIAVGGYVRRAVAKQIAADLGLPWEEVIKHTPYPATFAAPSARPKKEPVPDNGEGYGDW